MYERHVRTRKAELSTHMNKVHGICQLASDIDLCNFYPDADLCDMYELHTYGRVVHGT